MDRVLYRILLMLMMIAMTVSPIYISGCIEKDTIMNVPVEISCQGMTRLRYETYTSSLAHIYFYIYRDCIHVYREKINDTYITGLCMYGRVPITNSIEIHIRDIRGRMCYRMNIVPECYSDDHGQRIEDFDISKSSLYVMMNNGGGIEIVMVIMGCTMIGVIIVIFLLVVRGRSNRHSVYIEGNDILDRINNA